MTVLTKLYDTQVQPVRGEGRSYSQTRAEKEVRYAHYEADKAGLSTLDQKERRSIDLLKVALLRAEKPVVSCSFGIDSIITLYLVRKALVELGRDASDIDVVWNDTLNEFPGVRKYAQEMTDAWKLRLQVYKPEKPLKKIIEDIGGITSEYFTARKGDRRNGQPLSEKCCGTLKHKPMKRAIRENAWDLMINGLRADESRQRLLAALRADESRQRLLAALRDGEFFYSSHEWKSLVCRPIQWWNERDIWAYVKREEIPYNELYDQNIIRSYPENNTELIEAFREQMEEVGIDTQALSEERVSTLSIWQAHVLEDAGYRLFTPRTGCQMCPIPVKYGYLQFMRINYPRTYKAMVHTLGYGHALLDMIPEDVKAEVKALTGVDMNAEDAAEHLEEILEAKPCVFDDFGK